MKKAFFGLAVSLIVLATGVVYASTSTNGGTAPTLTQKGVEFIQTQFWTNGPASTNTIKSVSYTFNAHQFCMPNPINGACIWTNATTNNAYLCMTTTQTGLINNAPDLVCLDGIQPGTHSTSKFNGISINALSKRARWYFGFIVPGSGVLSPVWEGRSNSVTVTW